MENVAPSFYVVDLEGVEPSGGSFSIDLTNNDGGGSQEAQVPALFCCLHSPGGLGFNLDF